MKNNMVYKTSLTLSVFVLLLGAKVWGQNEVITQFAANLQSGNIQGAAQSFKDQVELDMDGKEAVVSKTESVTILANFFGKYPMKKFEYLHKGASGNSSYAIARYTYEGGAYRVTVKSENNLIEEISFKKE